MFKAKNNPQKDNKITEKLEELTEHLKNNRGWAYTIIILIFFFAIFGEKVLGHWFHDVAEFLQGTSIIIFLVGYMSFKSKKSLKDKGEKDYIFKDVPLLNLEKIIHNSFEKEVFNSPADYKNNKQEVVKKILDKKTSSKYDIYQSSNTELISGEWKVKLQALILLGILVSVYFIFVK